MQRLKIIYLPGKVWSDVSLNFIYQQNAPHLEPYLETEIKPDFHFWVVISLN